MVKTYIGSDLIKKVYIGTEKVKKIFIGTEQVYSASHIVTFHFLNDALAEDTVEVEIDDGADALLSAPPLPQRFSPTWSLTGWREDTVASTDVLQSKVVTTDNVHLYAVIQRTLTLTYNGNGGSGGAGSQTGTQYHNNGNSLNPTLIVSGNWYSRADYTFAGWGLNQGSTVNYRAGQQITLSDNATMYAIWTYTASRSFSVAPASVYAWYSTYWTSPISFRSVTINLSAYDSAQYVKGDDWLVNIGGAEYRLSPTSYTTTVTLSIPASAGGNWAAGTAIQIKNTKISWGPAAVTRISGTVGQ